MTFQGGKRCRLGNKNAKCGFPIELENLIDTVINIARDTDKVKYFVNQKLGITWYNIFFKRHPFEKLNESTKREL